MNRSTDQALRSLLPTHNGALPPQLAELAGSLLAQSRHRASMLKADEEIARPYACAHIACDRLKTSLNLPPIEPRPPIQPRLYKRLYTHLSTILKQASASGVSTRIEKGNSLSSPATPRKAALTPATHTPTKAPTPSGTPSKASSKTPAKTPFQLALSRKQVPAGSSPFPPWLRPTVRFVCHELGHARLAPSIVAGLSAIHREIAEEAKSKKQKGNAEKNERGENGDDNENDDDDDDDDDMEAWLEDNLTALTAALYLYCVTSWREAERERNIRNGERAGVLEERQFQIDEKSILGVFEKVRTVVGGRTSGGTDESAWVGWQDLQRRTFRDALVVVSEQQWLQNDWYQDVANLAGDNIDEDRDLEEAEEADDNDDVSIPTKVWRSDSMFQARYDFLSETKQQEYDAWRANLLESITGQLPQTQAQLMEVDSA